MASRSCDLEYVLDEKTRFSSMKNIIRSILCPKNVKSVLFDRLSEMHHWSSCLPPLNTKKYAHIYEIENSSKYLHFINCSLKLTLCIFVLNDINNIFWDPICISFIYSEVTWFLGTLFNTSLWVLIMMLPYTMWP